MIFAESGDEESPEDAVRDGHLITSIYYGFLPAFLRLLIDAIEG